jgi:uncharacterized membrane protein
VGSGCNADEIEKPFSPTCEGVSIATLRAPGLFALALSLIAAADLSIILNIPLLRQVFGFVLLTFLPGFLLIQIVRLTKNPLEKAVFLVGLSVSFLMFVPLLMDLAYPRLGISDPISLVPLTTTLSLILAGLSFVAYRTGALDFEITARDLKTFGDTIRRPPVIGAALLLVLSILGGLFIRFYSDSLFSLFTMLSIAAAVVLIVISDRASQRFYPLYILAIAIALQYSHTLTSPNLFGNDVHYELYFADLVRSSGYWDPGLTLQAAGASPYQAMLSVVVLPNVYSALLGVDNVFVYELVIPLIFAFVPIGLYQLYRTHIKSGNKSAFLGAFFFMSFYAFYLMEPRQDIAELFVVLAAILIVNRYRQELKRTALLIVFAGSIIVSHYSTTYIFLLYLGAILIGSTLLAARNRKERVQSGVNATLVALAVIIALSWYAFTAGGTLISGLSQFGSNTAAAFSSELFSSGNSQIATGLGIGVFGSSFVHALGYYWAIATEVLITLGLVLFIRQRGTLKTNMQFLLLTVVSFLLMLAAIALPPVANVISTYRLYSLVLLFLAPCCIYGIEAAVDTSSRWLRANQHLARKLKYVALIGVLVPYFLFNYGVIFEITEHPSNYAFLPTQQQSERAIMYSDNASWSYLFPSILPSENTYAITWLSSSTGGSPVYADSANRAQLSAYGQIPLGSLLFFTPSDLQRPLANAYVYLGASSVQQGTIQLVNGSSTEERQISSYPTLTAGDTIYSNGFAEVRYYPP